MNSMRNSECAMRKNARRASNGVANSCVAIHDEINSCRRQFILAHPEREGGPRKRWEGYLCFFIHTCCGYNGEVGTFSPIYPTFLYSSCAHAARALPLAQSSTKGSKMPFGGLDTARHSQNILIVRLHQQASAAHNSLPLPDNQMCAIYYLSDRLYPPCVR